MTDSLIQLVRSNPVDKRLAQRLFHEYQASAEHDQNDDLAYLQLKWLHSDQKWRYLNKLAGFYVNSGKKSIAFMCLMGSLIFKPDQPAVVELAESLKNYCGWKQADGLRDDKLTVSVIMPTYNRTAEIRESIHSVLGQTFQDFELVVVNDGGKDEVKEILDSFRSQKIKYYKLDRNKGLAGALNEGIRRAEGRYIAYLDDDDIYYSNHLGRLVEFIEERPEYDNVYSNAWWCSGENKEGYFVERSRTYLDRRPKRFDRELLFRQNYISTLNILHKKECFRKTGLFNEDLSMLMDWEMWMRFALEYDLCQLNVVTGEYRFKENNMSVIDQLTMMFLANVIRQYYATDRGQIVFLKHYLKIGEVEKAEEIYNKMLSHYQWCPLAVKKELLNITKWFSYRGSLRLLGSMARGGYFNQKVKRLVSRVRRIGRELFCY